MKQITIFDEKVLNTYLEMRNVKSTAMELGISKDRVSATLEFLTKKGILKQNMGKQYTRTKEPYETVDEIIVRYPGRSGKSKGGRLFYERPRKQIVVTMSDYEREWMWNNYRSDKRREAAKVLGRTRSDICSMAQALEIDMEGRFRNAKKNKRCSA